MRFVICTVFFLGCSEYSLNEKLSIPAVPDTAVEEELMENPPVALAGPSQRVKRNTVVMLDGTSSYDIDSDQENLLYSWRLVSVPEGSLAFLDNTSSPTPIFIADILGTYLVELDVTDSTGLISTYSSATLVEVVPYTNMRVEISWDIEGTDLDLHLLAPGGGYYDHLDCFYGNPNPDWGVVNSRADNPSLAMDDEGYERIEAIDYVEPYDGLYNIYVLYYRNRTADYPYVTPHLKIFAEGNLIADFDGPRLNNEALVWHAGVLDWSDLSFTQHTEMYAHQDLGGPDYD